MYIYGKKHLMFNSESWQLEQEKSQKEQDALSMDTELERVTDAIAHTSKENTALEDRLQVYMCVCVYVRACACMHVSICACMCV